MLNAVLNAVTACLNAGGLRAVRDFPGSALDRDAGPVVCVSLRSNKLLSAGAGDYMGEQSAGGEVSSVYGFRMEPVIALDIFAPGGGGASACAAAADSAAECLSELPSGLKLRALCCGETVYDQATEMFRCPLEIHAAAFLTRQEDAVTGEFTDFHLRGVIN